MGPEWNSSDDAGLVVEGTECLHLTAEIGFFVLLVVLFVLVRGNHRVLSMSLMSVGAIADG
jgi:hypothetical protein